MQPKPIANPIAPVLYVLEPTCSWPDTLAAGGLGMLNATTAALARRVRLLAVDAEHRLTPVGGQAPPMSRADVRMMQWAADAGRHATQVLRTANVRTDNHIGDELLSAVTAALTLREAEYSLGRSDEHHRTAALNRALWAADWVAQSRIVETVTGALAAQVFANHLAMGWRWEQRPDSQTGDGLPQDTWFKKVVTFSVAREVPGRPGYQRITVAGRGDQPAEITHRHQGSDTDTSLSWPEMCVLIARSQLREPAPTSPANV